jgi:large subunit ribosomal protein L35
MLKTKKAASSRFRISKSGHIKRSRAGKRHLLTTKSRNRKRRLRHGGEVAAVDRRLIRRLLPYG